MARVQGRFDVSVDLTAELAGIIDVSEEEARLRAQRRFEQTFEARAFGSRLVEYERNMAERTWQEVGANRAEVTSALEAGEQCPAGCSGERCL